MSAMPPQTYHPPLSDRAAPYPRRIGGAFVLSRPTNARRGLAWWVEKLSWGNLAAVALIVVLLCFVSERWWVSALLTYLPRQPYALPALILLPLALLVSRRVAWVNLLALLLVLGPIMGLTVPVDTPPPLPSGRTPLRIVSGNLQEGKGSLLKLSAEIERFAPNIVVFQEASRGCEDLLAEFADWEVAHLQSYYIASRYPLRVVDQCRADAFNRWSGVLVEIDTPDGTIRLGNVHLMTPRHGASGITPFSPLTRDGVDEFEWHQRLRSDESAHTRSFFEEHHDRPLLIAGDFNVPTTSSLFASHWDGLTSAFETAGWWYGYTSPCNASRKWLANTPWMRIDHLLADDAWTIHSCRIGQTDGSDHRLLFTKVSLAP